LCAFFSAAFASERPKPDWIFFPPFRAPPIFYARTSYYISLSLCDDDVNVKRALFSLLLLLLLLVVVVARPRLLLSENAREMQVAALGKKWKKKREKEETSLFYFPSPGFALFSHERERRDTRDADRKRERRKGREHQ